MGDFLPQIIVGFVTSAVVGYLSIRWLLGFLAKRPLFVFAVYVTVIAVGTLVSLAF
jgi:undecaprenyl-diphosphatase